MADEKPAKATVAERRAPLETTKRKVEQSQRLLKQVEEQVKKGSRQKG